MRFRWSFLLGQALRASHRSLRRMSDDEVPARLREVQRSSRLPPQHENRLARELDASSWLREKALEQWPDTAGALEVGHAERASALFLSRPEGWETELASLAWEAGRGAAGPGEDESRELEAARSAFEEARSRQRALERELDDAHRRLRETQREAAEPRRKESRREARAKAQLEAERVEWGGERSQLVDRIERVEGELAAALEKVRVERSRRAEVETRLAGRRDGGTWFGGGLELARSLDAIADSVGREQIGHTGSRVLAGLELPEGVSPDTAAALDAVLKHSGPIHLVVDGYNAALALGDGEASRVRARLEPVLGRVRTLATPPCAVTVVYDSSVEPSKRRAESGIEVRFASPDETADDVVIALAATPGTVVISSDRAVREAATQRGALALWSEALVDWDGRRT